MPHTTTGAGGTGSDNGIRSSFVRNNFLGTEGFSIPDKAQKGDLVVLCVFGPNAFHVSPSLIPQVTGLGTIQGNGHTIISIATLTATGNPQVVTIPSRSYYSVLGLIVPTKSWEGFSNGGDKGRIPSRLIPSGRVKPNGIRDVGIVFYQTDGLGRITEPAGLPTSCQAVYTEDQYTSTVVAGYTQLVSNDLWRPGTATNSSIAYSDSVSITLK